MQNQSSNDRNNRVSPRKTNQQISWFKDFFRRIQLGWYLFLDKRVPGLTKLIPLAALAYVISPIDLVPGTIIPGLGQLDDIAVFLMGLQLFVELSPYDVVDEHQQAIVEGYSVNTMPHQEVDEDVIDVEFEVEPEQDETE